MIIKHTRNTKTRVNVQYIGSSTARGLVEWFSYSITIVLYKTLEAIFTLGLTSPPPPPRLLQRGNERNYGGHKSSFIDEGPAECFSADAIKSSGLDIN